MDITSLFKACVKTVKTRNKTVGGFSDNYKNNILSHARPKTEFSSRAKDVVTNINKLRDLLLEHRKDYLNASSLTPDVSRMSDQECDQIDNETQTFMRTCSDTIKAFRTEMAIQPVCPQVREHRTAVLEMMEDYLKSICKIYSAQRAVRVKRIVDKRRLARLEPDSISRSSTPSSSFSVPTTPERSIILQQNREYNHSPMLDDEEISPEEAQMFEQENARLYDEMNSMANEVKQIEGKVVEISRLQEIFTEKVLQQEKDIDRIGDTVVGTTENVKDANEEIRSAIKNNAGFRVWILFFLVVMSFSLLFLDWFNQ